MIESFQKIPKDKFYFRDLTEHVQDFNDYEKYAKNLYFQPLISKIKDWEIKDNKYKNGTRKHRTKSELIDIKATNERYIVLYSIEER